MRLILLLACLAWPTSALASGEYFPPYSPANEAIILTPKPGPAPRINGPEIYGAGPGHPFLYRIPAQGERPMKFSAEHLPGGLHLDSETGIITGVTPRPGDYAVTLRAENGHGQDSRAFKIVSGDTLALTPPMGWNDWYVDYDRITEAKMRRAADLLLSSGLADAGYQYVNIDDCWMNLRHQGDPGRHGPFRDARGNILPNGYFPDMKALTDYIHARGLKADIYASPGPVTCGGGAGSFGHEAQDARQFARWGFDFLKYDWCSYSLVAHRPPTLDELKRPYRLMGGLLRRQDRDMLFNLCQYGMGDVWEWGADVGGQSWRTARDLGVELNRVFEVALDNIGHASGERPGAWNDPDYIQIGWIGNALENGRLEKCPFTPTGQYAFMSLWCLMSAPLFYSGDLTRLDDFTLNVLCNPEVIAIDQDPLGQCARVVFDRDRRFILVKNLEDGDHALGLCNATAAPADMAATWAECALPPGQRVRDVWREKDLGTFDDSFCARVPPHGVVLLRLTAAGKG